jgi:hypothetical protein
MASHTTAALDELGTLASMLPSWFGEFALIVGVPLACLAAIGLVVRDESGHS